MRSIPLRITRFRRDPRFAGDLGFLGNRLPDREARVEEFFLQAGGRNCRKCNSCWAARVGATSPKPANIDYFDHVYTRDHNAFNVTPRAVMNISRESMARYGFSPATRVFEAAGAAACLITDAWEGIEMFFEPGREILVAEDGDEVVEHVRSAHAGAGPQPSEPAAYRRVLAAAHLRAPRRHSRSGAGCPGSPERLDEPYSIWLFSGLSVTSSWGNGHATTYRSLIRGLAARGHRILFLERDAPWYAGNRDEPNPPGAPRRFTTASTNW